MMLTFYISVGWAETTTVTASKIERTSTTWTGTGGEAWSVNVTSGAVNQNVTQGYAQIGTKNSPSEYVKFNTTGITGTITSIVVDCASYNSLAKISATVGGNAFGTQNQSTPKWANNTGGSVTFTGSASGAILITMDNTDNGARAMYIKSITVTYTSGGTTPEPTTYSLTLPTGLTGGTVTATGASDLTAIAEGTSMTVTATPSSDSYELDWMKANGTEVSNPYTFNITENTTITAAFKEKQVTPPTPSGTNRFERITSTDQLEAGKRYLLVYESTPAVMGAISTTSTKYGTSVTGSTNFTLSNGVITLTDNSNVKPLTLGGSEGAWTFDLDGALLNHTSGNSLNTGTSNTTWTIAFSGNNATITNATNTTRVIKYNTGSPRFACYESGQQAIQLYKEVEEEVTVDDLYLIGYGMNGTENWNLTTAPQMTYSTSAGTYAVDVHFDKAQRGMFQFAKGLSNSNDNWNGLTGRLYPSTNGSNVNVDTYDMDGTVGLYFTDNSNMYSFELPAGLYTITANLSEWKTYVTQHPVTMTISPNSATFDDKKSVTLASNLTDLGGKIYYTTDGSTPSATNGTEYTGTITLNATTTIKAIAILNHIQSDVVEKTYTKTPAAPVIDPASCTFNEPLTVTITAESGATIYYTTDGSTPTDQSTQYTGPFTVSTTTTVKAIAYVGNTYGSVATAEFTYSNVQPSTGDFVLVTSASQLVAGNEYIIVYKEGAQTMDKAENSNNFLATDISLSSDGTTAVADANTEILTLEGSEGAWMFKVPETEGYLANANGGSNRLFRNGDANSANSKATITITADGLATIKFNSGDRTYLFYNGSGQTAIFSCYASKTNNYDYVSLYTRESNAVQPPVFTPAGGIYDVTVDVTISCATNGASIYYTTDGSEPTATNGILYDGNEIVVSNDATFKAVAVKNGNTSSVVTAEYTITPHTAIETVTLDYREPFTSGIGKFTVQNVSGYSPVWSLDGNYGIKGTAYSPNTNPTNNAATSRFLSPIIDMTDAVQPELTFSHQINSYFTDVTNQCQLFIRETTNGTDGTWVQLPITFSDPAAAGGWTNDLVDIDLSDYAGKKVQISFLYTNPTEGSGAGTWEIQNFVVADNSEYRMVNNIAEFLALENGTKAKFKNPVTVLYDYAQYSSNSYHEYIWVKDESGFMQFYLIPTLNSSTESTLDSKAAYYENGDIIPAGFVVVKNYYENGKYVQAYSAEALEAGFLPATQKGLADPEYMDFDVLDELDASDTEDVATWCNHYITLEKIKLTSSSKNFNFKNEDGTQNSCVGYNKYNGDGSLLKDGTTSADVIMPTDLTKFYDVKGIIQLWQGGWEFMPIEFTEWKEEEMTLRQLCQDGVVNQSYTISNNVLGVFAKDNRLWVKDDTGQSIHQTSQPDGEESYYIDAEGNTREEQAYYDQSNWLEVILPSSTSNPTSAEPYVGKIINGGTIKGQFTNKVNPTLVLDSDAELTSDNTSSYAPNYYCVANFMDWTAGANHLSQVGDDGKTYFFMNPKPQEYAMVTWVMWKDGKFVIPADGTIVDNNGRTHAVNNHNFNGAFEADWSLNANDDQTEALNLPGNANGMYEFHAIIRMKDSTSNGAPRNAVSPKGDQTASSNYVVSPTDLNVSENSPSIITAVSDVKAAGEVLSVTYYNVAGVQSSKPFDGINIVVTRYTDGTASTAKVVR